MIIDYGEAVNLKYNPAKQCRITAKYKSLLKSRRDISFNSMLETWKYIDIGRKC